MAMQGGVNSQSSEQKRTKSSEFGKDVKKTGILMPMNCGNKEVCVSPEVNFNDTFNLGISRSKDRSETCDGGNSESSSIIPHKKNKFLSNEIQFPATQKVHVHHELALKRPLRIPNMCANLQLAGFRSVVDACACGNLDRIEEIINDEDLGPITKCGNSTEENIKDVSTDLNAGENSTKEIQNDHMIKVSEDSISKSDLPTRTDDVKCLRKLDEVTKGCLDRKNSEALCDRSESNSVVRDLVHIGTNELPDDVNGVQQVPNEFTDFVEISKSGINRVFSEEKYVHEPQNKEKYPINNEVMSHKANEKRTLCLTFSDPSYDIRTRTQDNKTNNSRYTVGKKSRTSSAIIFSTTKTRRDSIVSNIKFGNHVTSSVRRSSITAKSLSRRRTNQKTGDSPNTLTLDESSGARIEHSKNLKVTIEIPVNVVKSHGQLLFYTDLHSIKAALQNNDSEIPHIHIHDRPKIPETHNILPDLTSKSHRQEHTDMSPRNDDGFSEKDAYSRSDKTRNVSIADVITSMTSQPRDYDSQLQGCIHLGSFANDASLDVILSKQQGISCIFAAMKQFPRDRNITQASCSSLAKMAAISEATCIHIVREKGLSVLMNVLRNNQNESDILLSTLGIIERISEIEEMQVELFEHSFHSEVLTTLSRHSDNPDVVSICLSILSNLIMAEETAKALMYIGGVHVVIGVVNPFPCNTLVLENACRCIGSFASHDDLGLDVANAGCIDIVINILEQIHDVISSRDQTKSLAECALYALACLSKYDEISTQISKRDNISLVIISPMTHLCENEAIQEYGSWIIANLASHDSSKHCACTPEVVNRLVTNLKDFPENLNLHLEIFSSLNSILSSCESLREHFVVTRAAECVFTTMATFNESPEILETGCLILGNLSIQENLRTPLEEQGCSSAIIAAMLSADHNAHVHEYGCVTMINISANVFDNKLRVARAGGVGVVMRTLQNFLDDAIVALCALKVLGNLLEVDEACYRFLEEDGLSILTTQYRCHGDDLEMLAFICDLLVQTSPKLELSDPSLETMESMLAEIHGDHGNEPELSLSVCQFYEALSLHEIGFKKFVISRGMDRVQSIAATHPTHVEIHTSCCRTLASYYMHTRESRVNLEHVQLVRKALNTFPCDIDLLTACLGAITYMTEHSDSTRQHLLQEGVLQEMTSVMQHHHDVARLQVVGLMSVDNILNVAEAKAVDDVTDFTMLVLDIMTKHIDNSDVQLFCCKIITLLQNIEADHTSKDHLLIPLVDVLRRRRSTGEVKSSARKALQQILGDEKYEELLCMHDLNGDVETRCTPNI